MNHPFPAQAAKLADLALDALGPDRAGGERGDALASPVASACVALARRQWAAVLGNLTPDHGGAVFSKYLERSAALGAKHLPGPWLRALGVARCDLACSASKEALRGLLADVALPALEVAFGGDCDEARAVALAHFAERLVACADWEPFRAGAVAADLADLDATLEALFRKLDDDWYVRKPSKAARVGERLGAAALRLMVATVARMPRDLYGAHLELFVSKRLPGQEKRAKFPTSKAPLLVVFHSIRLIFGRAIISRNGFEAWVLFLERARVERSR